MAPRKSCQPMTNGRCSVDTSAFSPMWWHSWEAHVYISPQDEIPVTVVTCGMPVGGAGREEKQHQEFGHLVMVKVMKTRKQIQ